MTSRRNRKRPATTTEQRWFDGLAAWLSAGAAVAGVLLTAVGVFGLATREPASSPTPTATGSVAAGATPGVTLSAVTTDDNEVSADGTFQALDPEADAVLLIGQPAGTEQEWLPVVATLFAQSVEPNGRQSGDWHAARPGVQGRYVWYAVIAPRPAGAGDPYADLRENGPNSNDVGAASEPLTTGSE
jgi:hypothetical protein